VSKSKDTSAVGERKGPQDPRSVADRAFAEQLVERARAEGVELVGPGGLLAGLTKQVLETGLEVEMDEHLGYGKHERRPEDCRSNSRNGTRTKTVLTDVGPIPVQVPRDRDATFDPKVVRKRQRRLDGVDAMVISLVAKGWLSARSRPTSVRCTAVRCPVRRSPRSPTASSTSSRLGRTGRWTGSIRCYSSTPSWSKNPRRQVTNRPIYTAVGVTVDGERDILALWVGSGGEGAKFWLQVLTEVKNRGTEDVCIVVCDGLKGLPEAIEATWPLAVVQTCVLHLIRNTFRLASRADWDAIARDLRPIYVAPTEQAAKERLSEFAASWAAKYPAIIRL
jgi:putative transposase